MSERRVAVFSMHTSPLAQPGAGDGGGMNVYVDALASALARAGVECDVYTRAEHPEQPDIVEVEPGFRVLHVEAGPRGTRGQARPRRPRRPVRGRGARTVAGVATRRRPARELLAFGRGCTPAQAPTRSSARGDVPHARARQGGRRARGRAGAARAHRARGRRVCGPDARVDRRRTHAARVALRRRPRSHRGRRARRRPHDVRARRPRRSARDTSVSLVAA